jgi:hypothetical protein
MNLLALAPKDPDLASLRGSLRFQWLTTVDPRSGELVVGEGGFALIDGGEMAFPERVLISDPHERLCADLALGSGGDEPEGGQSLIFERWDCTSKRRYSRQKVSLEVGTQWANDLGARVWRQPGEDAPEHARGLEAFNSAGPGRAGGDTWTWTVHASPFSDRLVVVAVEAQDERPTKVAFIAVRPAPKPKP